VLERERTDLDSRIAGLRGVMPLLHASGDELSSPLRQHSNSLVFPSTELCPDSRLIFLPAPPMGGASRYPGRGRSDHSAGDRDNRFHLSTIASTVHAVPWVARIGQMPAIREETFTESRDSEVLELTPAIVSALGPPREKGLE
jgi:hypothetical protein